MQKNLIIIILLAMLVLVSGMAYSFYRGQDVMPFYLNPGNSVQTKLIHTVDPVTGRVSDMTQLPEKPSPYSRVNQSQIEVYQDKIVIHVNNSEWATFTDTNSMDPVFDTGNYAIEVKPNSTADINVGDIIAYNDGNGDVIIHRVISIGQDQSGWYAMAKGDNAPDADNLKVRFDQVKDVVVMVIY